MLIVVVLPAPLGPRNPSTSPVLISRSTESTATWVPKIFVSSTVRATTWSGYIVEGWCDTVFMVLNFLLIT